MTPAAMLLAVLAPSQGEVKPRFAVGKDTTFVTGPLKKDGTIDYQAALNDRLGKGVTPKNNANVLLWRAGGPLKNGKLPAGYYRRLGIKPPPAQGDYLVNFIAFAKDRLAVTPDEYEILHDEADWAGRRPWAAKDFPRVAKWLKANEKPLNLVTRAARRPAFFNPLVSPDGGEKPGTLIAALLPTTQRHREFARALSCRAMLRLGEKKYDAAWADLMTCHRLARLTGRGGTAIEGLVSYAVESIACAGEVVFLGSGPHPAARLRKCLADLRSLPRRSPVADQVNLAERFMFLELVQLARTGDLNKLGPLPGVRPPRGAPAAGWEDGLRLGNRMYDRVAAAARLKTRAGRDAAFAKISADVNAMKKNPAKPPAVAVCETLVGLCLPAFNTVTAAHDRVTQQHRNNVVAFALGAYRADRGRYPAKLARLAPAYLPKVPGDIHGGRLKYKLAANGFLLYGVGNNGRDEGGRSFGDTPRGDDLPVRLPLPPLKIDG